MTDRRSWLHSRHLTRSEQGQRALDSHAALPSEGKAAILRTGDELAAHSVSLAHVYFVSAVPLYEAQPKEFLTWEGDGIRILGRDAGGRTAALAYTSRSWPRAA